MSVTKAARGVGVLELDELDEVALDVELELELALEAELLDVLEPAAKTVSTNGLLGKTTLTSMKLNTPTLKPIRIICCWLFDI